ncbi:MAG TPA: c-type cytochrome biogenesis protein CcmI [Caulobacteraceae bacterium]
MIVWIILTLMIALAAIGVTIPLVRRHDARRGRTGAVEVLREQLADIDAQAAAQTLPSGDAEGLRTEVSRRILAEGKVEAGPARPLGEWALLVLGLGLAATVALVAALLYSKIGRPDLTGVSSPPAPSVSLANQNHPGTDIPTIVAQLERRMKQAPGDPEGWRMLGWSYMQVGRYGEAANAYGKASALEPAKGEFLSAQGEALTLAAGGRVTPAARTAFGSALAGDPADPRARYFLAMAKDQSGDHAGALADWVALLKSAPPDAPWAGEVRAFVERTAAAHGEDLTGKLPPAAAPAAPDGADAPTPGPAGPTAAQVAAAQRMAPSDQRAMIGGMVEALASRLKANPKDPDGWLRLMRARMVLGQSAAAAAAYQGAMHAYGQSPSQQAAFREAARELRIPGS